MKLENIQIELNDIPIGTPLQADHRYKYHLKCSFMLNGIERYVSTDAPSIPVGFAILGECIHNTIFDGTDKTLSMWNIQNNDGFNCIDYVITSMKESVEKEPWCVN